jgi:tRNA U34 5-carboxymethylaminomethyl modifying GTPase MnmE/TrmE
MFSGNNVKRLLSKFHNIEISRHCCSTVFAMSSGYGTCGVAVIRITGAQAGPALLQMTGQDKLPTARKAMLRKLIDPKSKEVLDHALTLWFPGPYSFTGEDSAELQVLYS